MCVMEVLEIGSAWNLGVLAQCDLAECDILCSGARRYSSFSCSFCCFWHASILCLVKGDTVVSSSGPTLAALSWGLSTATKWGLDPNISSCCTSWTLGHVAAFLLQQLLVCWWLRVWLLTGH